MKRNLILLFLLATAHLYGQKLKVTAVNEDYFHHEKVEGFIYLHEDMPAYGYTWIGTIQIELDTVVMKSVETFYQMAQERANRLGANAFRIGRADMFSYGKQKHVEFQVFHLRMENRDENRAYFYRKSYYLFGFLGHHRSMDGYTVKVNGEKLMLEELSYYSFHPKIGDEVVLELGGWFKKDKVKYRVSTQELPRYFSFHMYRGIFNTHEITEYDWSYGEYLMKVLEKKAIPAELSFY